MNGITPGPFAARRKGSNETTNSDEKKEQPPLAVKNGDSTREDELNYETKRGQPQRTFSASSEVSLSSSVGSTTSSVVNRAGKAAPPRPLRPSEPIDGFLAALKEGQVTSDWSSRPVSPSARSNTFPTSPAASSQSIRSNTSPTPSTGSTLTPYNFSRAPSAPAVPPVRSTLGLQTENQPTSAAQMLPDEAFVASPIQESDRTKVPPRGDSRNGTRIDYRLNDAPPVPMSPTVQTAFQAHSTHPSTDSASSTSSTHSARSYGSGSARLGPSPATSAASSMTVLSNVNEEPFEVPNAPAPLQSRPKPNQYHSTDSSDSDNAWPMGGNATREPASKPRPVDTPLAGSPVKARPSPQLNSRMDPPESPMDPALQSGQVRRPQPPESSPSLRRQQHGFGAPQHRRHPVEGRPSAPRERRPGTGTASKHTCRGCQEPITGKSVKAADGRLTGRYHKQCFVCKTCNSPFATADFYVIDNDPYCERHYHQLNDSLCTSCDRGIEGQYLETQQRQKFHPHCFTCIDCNMVLSDDYFEINGRVYCERHAFTAIRAQSSSLGPNKNWERRTTRLMVM